MIKNKIEFNMNEVSKLITEIERLNLSLISSLREIRDRERDLRIEEETIKLLPEYKEEKRVSYKSKIIKDNTLSFKLVIESLKDSNKEVNLKKEIMMMRLKYLERELEILNL